VSRDAANDATEKEFEIIQQRGREGMSMDSEMDDTHPESTGGVDRRAFLRMAGTATGAAVVGGIPDLTAAQTGLSAQLGISTAGAPRGGHLYMQTNEIRNAIIHYRWSTSGTLTEVERVPTGGAGSGTFKPTSGQQSAPNAFEGAGSVILTGNRRFLFTTNGGDNSVSSFSLDKNGRLTKLDVKPTGNPIDGKSGTAKSLAYAATKGILYVLHSFGPDHLRLMSVDDQGKLTARPERYTANTKDKADRVPTMAVLSPDGEFLLVGTVFDVPPVRAGFYPDGSPILWLPQATGKYKVIASNAPDPDGLAVFPVRDGGTLGAATFHDAKGGSPFYIAFLNHRPDTFVIGYAVGDGCAVATIDGGGNIDVGPLVKVDTSPGLPSELCWLAVSPDDRFVYATNFGYSYISSFRIDGNKLSIAADPACPKVPGDGTARGLNTTVISGPADIWMTPDGAYVYQIYGNASKLVGYAAQPDGSLKEVASAKIPYNSPQGLAGF
jgi:6-phosphogluconolactonase (cycloisomerase 2 family)